MSKETQNLQDNINFLLSGLSDIIQKIKNHESPESEDLQKLSKSIWATHHFAKELLDTHPPESIYYNANIIKQIIETQIPSSSSSLVESADKAVNDSDEDPLRNTLEKFAKSDISRNVFFEDLKEIAQDLAA